MERHQAASDFPPVAHYNNGDEIDLGQLLLDIRKRWRTIFLITFAGTLLAVAVALMIPKEYKPATRLTLPKDMHVERFNQHGLVELERKELFKRYYQALRSEANFRNFITENAFLGSLYEDFEQKNSARLMANLTDSFAVSIIEPQAPKGESVEFPTLIEASLQHTNETAAVKLLNTYVTDTNMRLVNDFIAQFKQIKMQREEQLNQQITLLRQAAKYEREQEIARKEATNNLTIQQLENEKQLLVELAKGNRKTQLAEVSEALKIATTLNIENPTPIDEFSASNSEAATNIKLSSNQDLPLYLMGTRYLKALTDTLNSRENEAVFLSEINQLDKEIKAAKNDPRLAQLKARESDDPYIEELPRLVQQLSKLEAKALNIADVQLYQTDKSATVTNKAVKPNRPLIAILGLMLSGMVALVVALVSASMARRSDNSVRAGI
jgi:LPS O-antigen subunit length determinant protein (WzzB/FepE family)